MLTPWTGIGDIEVIAALFGWELGAGLAGDGFTEGGGAADELAGFGVEMAADFLFGLGCCQRGLYNEGIGVQLRRTDIAVFEKRFTRR